MITETQVRIQSASSKDEYTLTLENDIAVKCSCPDCFYRKHVCKHQTRFNACTVVNAFVKPSGIICARVIEGDNSYFVTIYPNGNGECCTCCVGASGCVHTSKVRAQASTIQTVPEMDADTVAALAEVSNITKMAEYRKHTADDAYEVLATTKNVNPRTGMTDAEWQQYRYYEMGIGA